jgi:alpha-tubulin suppressor-like RCC1 family protein
VSLASGVFGSCAILAGGTVSCWGRDVNGELGISPSSPGTCGSESCITTPTLVPELTNVTQLQVGENVGCALRADGTVWCWGRNVFGSLGLGDVDAGYAVHPPAPVPGLDDAVAIAVGVGDHVCVIRADGSVWCWGNNRFAGTGQPLSGSPLCLGTPCTRAPTQVAGIANVRAIGLGTYHSCALTDADQVFCWGYTGDGELGRDPRLDVTDAAIYPCSNTPAFIDLPPVASLAVGELHACVVLKDGSVRCWGQAYLGQLGWNPTNGAPDGGPLLNSYVPMTVPGL